MGGGFQADRCGFFYWGFNCVGCGCRPLLDSLLNTEPVLVIVGLISGIVVAFYGVYQMLLPLIGSRGDKENS